MPTNPLLKVEELSIQIGLPKAQTYELIRQKLLPPGVVVKLGRRIRINGARLEEFLAAGGTIGG